jgi:carbonic anhydrase/acetyltransferase-like protein (isoleucine patch superfamily)
MPFHTNHNIRLAAASLLALLLSSYLFANNGHAEELREISKVNGGIRIAASEQVGEVSSVNGDVLIRNGSVIEGDVVFEGRRRGWTRWFNWGNKRPDLVIDADAEVKGDIRLYHEVTLKIAEGARVGDIKRHYRD